MKLYMIIYIIVFLFTMYKLMYEMYQHCIFYFTSTDKHKENAARRAITSQPKKSILSRNRWVTVFNYDEPVPYSNYRYSSSTSASASNYILHVSMAMSEQFFYQPIKLHLLFVWLLVWMSYKVLHFLSIDRLSVPQKNDIKPMNEDHQPLVAIMTDERYWADNYTRFWTRVVSLWSIIIFLK